MTYRFRGHSLVDPDELRDPEEKAFWAERDPIRASKPPCIPAAC